MQIDGILTYSPQQLLRSGSSATADGGTKIGEQITAALGEVNTLEQTAGDLAQRVASGDVEDAHKAMIAMERALLALDFTIQVRNKALEAYQEIMRTQV